MPRPKKKTKPLTVWVTRDKGHNATCSNWYNVFTYKPSDADKGLHGLHWHGHKIMSCNPNTFEIYFFKLERGAGPVKCEIIIRRVK